MTAFHQELAAQTRLHPLTGLADWQLDLSSAPSEQSSADDLSAAQHALAAI